MEERKVSMPLLGDEFPNLKVRTTQGIFELPGHFKGKWFVLFSHPADFTPVCTTEFMAFQQRYDEFKALNCELIGLSVDQVFSHMNVDIQFPVIADTGKVAGTLGLVHPGKGTNTVRAVFIIDPEGKLRAMIYYPPELGRNIDEILRAVKAFQVSDDNEVAMPANWPNNEILKDRVILPPPTDVDGAKERLAKAEAGEFESYDWWLSHKEIK